MSERRRLCHKDSVIANDRRGCGDLYCVVICKTKDCHVVRPGGLLAKTVAEVFTVRIHNYDAASKDEGAKQCLKIRK